MKTCVRLVQPVLAGLSLAGCYTKPNAQKETPAPRAIAFGDQPLSGRYYWLSRDFDDRIDRAISSSSASTGARR